MSAQLWFSTSRTIGAEGVGGAAPSSYPFTGIDRAHPDRTAVPSTNAIAVRCTSILPPKPTSRGHVAAIAVNVLHGSNRVEGEKGELPPRAGRLQGLTRVR